ncbi:MULTISPECIES: hypothetical protein [Methylobacterium]|uniref:Uncharacterized protein n=1 Tax=Methylobacterium thuringiense TaxID=1003091 RepID=A0ABQ4TQB2_9HYPH|nr:MULTISPECIES: hypothetical protein [Methylobacterium]TXN20719.1 hypothetical protein FV217_17020 [Methylobacterium sp. WL9]GJE55820.1 hypothetical protein EKPJFOCH_2316 [Methylobacterium thuringiense]
MLKGSILLAGFLAGTGTAFASLSGLVGAWGHDFAVTPFAPKELMVAVATDKATGKQFNVVKMSDGHLMAVVPFDAMKEPPGVPPKDLM